jgi:hypothetical protein
MIASGKLRELAVSLSGVSAMRMGGTGFDSLADAMPKTKIGAVQIGPHAAQT